MLCEDLTVRLLRDVAVTHVALVEGTAFRVPGEDFSHLFPGKILEGLVPVEGVTSLVLREVVSALMHGEVVTDLMPEEAVACVVAGEGSVGLTTVEDLARLVVGKLAAGLAPGEPPEEGIPGLVVGSALTAHSRGSVGGSRVDGKR